MKISKYLSIMVLVLIALLLSGFTYAYWVGNVGDASKNLSNFEGETVVIGEAKDISTVIDIGAFDANAKKLVPENNVDKSVGGAEENTSVRNITIPIKWVEEPKTGKAVSDVVGNLSATHTITLTGLDDEAIKHLFDITVTYNSVINLNGAAVDLVVNVKFVNEPRTKAEYDAVINKNLEFAFDILIKQNN